MNKPLFFCVFTLVLFTKLAFGQTPPPDPSVKATLPPGPLIVTQMPEFSSWTIDYTYTDTPKPGDPSRLDQYKQAALKDPALAKAMESPAFAFGIQNIRPLHVVVTKTGNIQHEARTLEQGYTSEAWAIGSTVVEKKPMITALVAGSMVGLEGNAFPDFDWISKDNFMGIQVHNNVKCLAFKEDQYNQDHEFIGTRYAFVDAQTHYPVSYQFGVETSQYTMLPPPDSKQTVPDDFAAAAKAMTERVAKVTPHLATP